MCDLTVTLSLAFFGCTLGSLLVEISEEKLYKTSQLITRYAEFWDFESNKD